MFDNILLPNTKKVLETITGADLPPRTYLAGGTAIALYLGHRRSQDLDFFTPFEFHESQWEQKLKKTLDFTSVQRDWQTLIGYIKKVKFSLFYYSYPLIEPTSQFTGVEIASLPDLAAMKLDTIVSRGTKRDFIDLYVLSQRYGLQKLFEFYQHKYGNFEEKELMIRKALVYFMDADADEMPYMLTPIQWKTVKQFFTKEITSSHILE